MPGLIAIAAADAGVVNTCMIQVTQHIMQNIYTVLMLTMGLDGG